MLNNDNSTDIIVQDYVVCIIDLLGQRDKLLEWEKVARTNPTLEQLLPFVKRTASTVTMLRDGFVKAFEQFDCPPTNDAYFDLTTAQKSKYEEARKCHLQVKQFSDTLVFYSPVKTSSNVSCQNVSCLGLFRILHTCAAGLLNALALEIPIRGAVAVASGLEIKSNESGDWFYGPGLAIAHHAESKLALSPRILVCNSVIDFLNVTSQYNNDPAINDIMKKTALECAAIICDDIDGKKSVDFAGAKVLELCKNSEKGLSEYVNCVRNSYMFACKEKMRFTPSAGEQSGNQKLVHRYTMLMQYLESRMPLWGMQPSDCKPSTE